MINKSNLKYFTNEDIEIELFLEAMHLKYGYDFRSYSRAHIKRRILKRLSLGEFESISQMQNIMINDKQLLEQILLDFSINSTEMFRDPQFFLNLRNNILPFLNTYPHIRIWLAGCSSGEEVYSLAILLKEEGLYNKSIIYATDFNESILHTAKEAIYPINVIKDYTHNYQLSGGESAFSNYYTAMYNSVKFDNDLKKNIVFAQHNLVTDSSFSDMHLILCRNVLIYFDKDLKNKAIKLFFDSLNKGCFLCLGIKENLLLTDYNDKFNVFLDKEKIYRKELY